MKVVCIDNYGRGGEAPGHDDSCVKENLTEKEAKDHAELLNSNSRRSYNLYYIVVPDDYKLRVFEP